MCIGNKIFLTSALICIFSIIGISKLTAQNDRITLSGLVIDEATNLPIPFVNIILYIEKDSSFASGTVSGEDGRFTFDQIKPNTYFLEYSYIGYKTVQKPVYVGRLSPYLSLDEVVISEVGQSLNEIVISGKKDAISSKMDKKTFEVADNISQGGGSVLASMQNLPGVSVQDGKILLRGNEKVAILIDGKQTALTGFGSQSGLDNIPASAIERIEIINNPSAKFDANGNAGIINIIFKKNKNEGFSGKVGLSGGLGALWVRKENLPEIRPQFQQTPKINPSLSLNYRSKKINAFVQADDLYTHTLNKNEFVTRTYDDGTVIFQQLKRNRKTNFLTTKGGLDIDLDQHNSITFSGLFGSEKILDNGDQPFFNGNLNNRYRLWQFLEDELKTTAMATMSYKHKFNEAGHELIIGYNYTFHREDEKYFFTNINPTFTGEDSFKLLSDEKVSDINIDYLRPFRFGRLEAGVKFRKRDIPTDMQFFPGLNSPLDINAGGAATYKEIIPAVYGNYLFENKIFEAEVGLRVEYVKLQYDVDPNHNTYKSDGYNYTQPFPNLRIGYKINEAKKITFFYNRRVDRPNEVDIRIFPKYDDAEIIKVGNPALKPQFTNTLELGYKSIFDNGYVYVAGYHKFADATITRISSTVPGSNLIYAIFQNVNKSFNSGLELMYSHDMSKKYSFNVNVNAYHNQINAFTVYNLYPQPNTFNSPIQEIYTGSVKWNNIFHFANKLDGQITFIYLAPDIIPQGKILQRFSIDAGIKKSIQNGKGEVFLNATDLLNTMIIKKDIQGQGFSYTSADYYETQVIRIGYSRKF